MLRDLAFVGIGLGVVTANAAKEAFNALSRRGESVRQGDGSLAEAVDGFVTHDCPAAVGHALGYVVDGALRAIEGVATRGRALPGVASGVTDAVLRRLGIPSPGDIARLRARIDTLSAQLDAIGRAQAPPPPWEEPDEGDVTAP